MGIILDPNIPYTEKDLKKAILITYRGNTLITTEEAFNSGEYRMQFIKKFGACLPVFSGKAKAYFSPNLEEIIDVELKEDDNDI